MAPEIILCATEFGLAIATVGIWFLLNKERRRSEELDSQIFLLFLSAGGLAAVLMFAIALVANIGVVLGLGGKTVFQTLVRPSF